MGLYQCLAAAEQVDLINPVVQADIFICIWGIKLNPDHGLTC